jgi:hypothetical protein
MYRQNCQREVRDRIVAELAALRDTGVTHATELRARGLKRLGAMNEPLWSRIREADAPAESGDH